MPSFPPRVAMPHSVANSSGSDSSTQQHTAAAGKLQLTPAEHHAEALKAALHQGGRKAVQHGLRIKGAWEGRGVGHETDKGR